MEDAVKQFKQAAKQGNPGGRVYYGLCVEKGTGTVSDKSIAARMFKLAAFQKDSDGEFNYGRCLENGSGVRRNRKKAAKYPGLAI
jgi:TPR repeat protein